MAKEILHTEVERHITLDELVKLVLPDMPEGAQVTVHVYDPVHRRTLPLGLFGTELHFGWTCKDRERETEADAPTVPVKLVKEP